MLETVIKQHACCSLCWHSPETPCYRFVYCLTEGPLCHTDEACQKKRQSGWVFHRREHVAKPTISIATSTCGVAAGAKETLTAIRRYLAERKLDVNVIETGCLGLCSEEPLMGFQLPGKPRVIFRNVKEAKVTPILESAFSGVMPVENLLGQHRTAFFSPLKNVPLLDEHVFFSKQKRHALKNCGVIDPTNIVEYLAHGGFRAFAATISGRTPREMCDVIESSGLRGRGGAGFFTGKKWKIVLNQAADQKYIICNANEGDPGAFAERSLMEGDPFSVLEGLAIGAYSVGASVGYIYLRSEYKLAIVRLTRAIELATEWGLLGNNILDSGFSFKVSVVQGAGAFICGEETALISNIEGKRGIPRLRPAFPAIKGLFNEPTAINNVATLVLAKNIAEHGAAWFRAMGAGASRGTKILSLSGHVRNKGFLEVEMGTRLRELVFQIGGGVPGGKKFKGVYIGGPSGGCINESELNARIDFESLKSRGAILASGSIVVMDEDHCIIDMAKFCLDFFQRESCGKCISCREGTQQVRALLERITERNSEDDGKAMSRRMKEMMHVQRMARVIQDTSLCGLGQAAANPVLSTMRWFMDEYEAHVFRGECSAKVCKGLLNYVVSEEKCNRCQECIKSCPKGAIRTRGTLPVFIASDKCIRCGLCSEVCPKKAIQITTGGNVL